LKKLLTIKRSIYLKKICIMGLGYIGLPSAALLASRGYSIVGVDISKDVVHTINRGQIHIIEPDLDEFVSAAVSSGKLRASLEPEAADVFIISVPTPFKGEYVPDISYVDSAVSMIAPYVKDSNLVILESTSPVGTTERVGEVLKRNGVHIDHVHIAHCPERVLPGKIMLELVSNDRIVGGLNEESTEIVAKFYETFVSGKVLRTDAKTAEFVKLVENSSRDVQIAFANELSILSDKFGVNVWEVIELANKHPRVNILQPGTGVGGHCIAVDPWFIVHSGEGEAKLIESARNRNLEKTEWVIKEILSKSDAMEKDLGRLPKIACMGLAFKPNIDDLRESPALYVFNRLKLDKLDVIAVEPHVEPSPEKNIYGSDAGGHEIDLYVFLVSHDEFSSMDMTGNIFLDFCGVYK